MAKKPGRELPVPELCLSAGGGTAAIILTQENCLSVCLFNCAAKQTSIGQRTCKYRDCFLLCDKGTGKLSFGETEEGGGGSASLGFLEARLVHLDEIATWLGARGEEVDPAQLARNGDIELNSAAYTH